MKLAATALLAAAVGAQPVLESSSFVYVEPTGDVQVSSSLPAHERYGSPRLHDGARNAAWQWDYRPQANPEAVVHHGSARFTVLTNGVIRMEWSPHAQPVFHDSASMAIVNRWFDDAPSYAVSVEGTTMHLETELIDLHYDSAVDVGAAFTPGNTRAVIKASGAEWRPGMPASGSMHGEFLIF